VADSERLDLCFNRAAAIDRAVEVDVEALDAVGCDGSRRRWIGGKSLCHPLDPAESLA
jgi:hypothetical protein